MVERHARSVWSAMTTGLSLLTFFSYLWKRLDSGVVKIQIKYGQYTNCKSANANRWQ